ncbi:hypothetical protein MMC26_007697 [Xylographa opegraphella]|nr:hypothetical protein [Xylographa opegraphella]
MPENSHEHHSNVSADLIWEIARSNNAFLVKRRSGGGVQFSRDSFNLVNTHSRKVKYRVSDIVTTPGADIFQHAGFVNDKAVGILPGAKGGLTLTTKKTKHLNRPIANVNEVKFGADKSGPKVYKNIVNVTAKQGYRPDLRRDAVARASAIRMSSRTIKETPEKKVRGRKAKQAAATE